MNKRDTDKIKKICPNVERLWSHRVHWPVYTDQKAQKEKADQCLDLSELPVLNSPVRLVQLEHNVHEPLGNMPTSQIEHSSEHSEEF